MLEHTFLHLPGVGEKTERSLWEQGIVTWADAIDSGACPTGFSSGRWGQTCRLLEQSLRSLQRGDHRHFAEALASAEHWRAWRDFRRGAAYLDIETTGCSSHDQVTVVGLYDGVRTCSFISGDNLDQLPEVISQYSMLVTFNGSSFDVPFLRRRFPGLQFDHLHVDLMHVLRRLGLRGGLKAIERRVGIARHSDIAHLDGWDAVRLWREWCRGSDESLELLVRYNTADIENLERLAGLAYRQLRSSLRLPCDDGGEGQ
ncbi:MAG: ribonuclease H-like domain-containing protein [Armatimonadota bacterium]|nr:ribonuclease H-like domain-containing protein [Armatimonadota bacterium]